MEEKIEEVLKQYPLQMVGKKKIRGAILLETKEGIFSLINYKDSLKRLLLQEQIKQVLIDSGYIYVDKGVRNESGEILTRDGRGGRWFLKKWFQGRECNLLDEKEILMATQHLAMLHNRMLLPEEPFGETEDNFRQTALKAAEERDITEVIDRHTREMRRVYNYIRGKKKRNEMEICILKLFPAFYEQAGSVQEYFAKLDCVALQKNCIRQGRMYHGNYNYHNILFQGQQIVTTNFEGSELGIPITDLYDFIRKIMEKNNWDTRQGLEILNTYRKARKMEKEEAMFLYLLLLFPEKFWKQINFYYNGKKSWMSIKNYDKLLKIQSQEERRRNFLAEAKSLLF